MKLISNGVWAGVAYSQSVHDVLLAAACTALALTVRHASPRHKREPLPGGLTTPFRATQHCDQQAGRPCDQQAGRPHCAVGAVETASPSVQTPRTQLGGDGDSLEEKVEQAAGTPQITKRHVQGDVPQPPKRSRISYPPGASQRPTPDCSAAEPPHVGAPAFSSPPAGGQCKTYLPEPTAVRCTGLRAGARVSKRASAPGSSFRTHAGNTSTVDSVLGLPVFVVPYKSPFLQPTGTGTVGQRVLQPSRTTNRFV